MRRGCLLLVGLLTGCRGLTPEALVQVDTICASVTGYLRADRRVVSPTARTVVFRCRPQDRCGGLGHQMAGLASAAYIAFRANRSLRADVRGLHLLFGTLGDPSPPTAPLQYPPVNLTSPPTMTVVPVEGSPKSAVLNALGGWVNGSILPALEPYRTVYYHSNRGVGTSLLFPGSVPPAGLPLWNINRCILRALLKPRRAFLNHTVDLLRSQPLTLREILDGFRKNEVTSIGIHTRPTNEQSRSTDMAAQRRANETVRSIDSCIHRVYQDHRHTVVFPSANAPLLIEALLTRYPLNAAPRVMAQVPRGPRPVGSKEGRGSILNISSPNDRHATDSLVPQSLVDIWILSRTRVLYTEPTDFAMGAVLISEKQPFIIHLGSCGPHPPSCLKTFC
eukprot:TRINITY_DN3911_c0_g1_i1.p1 TRINITY_DN3911_c0_g1~~TRINITY_DN3911_c0_g1_i1.p1  ORF type:complete len:400 (+),score=51.43 TRINITY_DN3911_c0_g1_i1:25-1200(+)